MIDEKRIKRFIEGAKEAFKEVDNKTFNFPMTILSAYELATSIEELLKEREAMQVKTDMYGNAYCPWCSTDRTIEMGAQKLHIGTQFCPYCGKAVMWE